MSNIYIEPYIVTTPKGFVIHTSPQSRLAGVYTTELHAERAIAKYNALNEQAREKRRKNGKSSDGS